MTHARRLEIGTRLGRIAAEPRKGGWIVLTITMPTGEAIEAQLTRQQALDARDQLDAALAQDGENAALAQAQGSEAPG